MVEYFKRELKPILDTQRNRENKEDCGLQCHGIAQFVQAGWKPAGTIATGSRDEETTFNSKFNLETFKFESQPVEFEKFELLMDDDQDLTYEAVSYSELDENLKQKAKEEKTGFLHGILFLSKYKKNELGHMLYFFSTKDEVLYIENQWTFLSSQKSYPFYNDFPEFLYDFFGNEEYSYHTDITFIPIGNWYFRWGEKRDVHNMLTFSIRLKTRFAKKAALFFKWNTSCSGDYSKSADS